MKKNLVIFICAKCGKRESVTKKTFQKLKTFQEPRCHACRKELMTYICPCCEKSRTLRLRNFEEMQFKGDLRCRYCRSKETREKTNLGKYGKKHSWQVPEIREKCAQTLFEKTGFRNCTQNPEVREKKSQKYKKLTGYEQPLQNPEVRKKAAETLRAKSGYDHNWKNPECYKKCRETYLKKTGYPHPDYNPEALAKRKRDYFEKTGYLHPSQNPEVQKNRRKSYMYSGQQFDSLPELCFYIYCKDSGKKIQRNNSTSFFYNFQNQKHVYIPDFEMDGTFYEIKGDQFLNEVTGAWQNPFSHSQDDKYEAKHQCAIQNKVEILYSKDYQRCIDYVLEKYGRDFFEKCKS